MYHKMSLCATHFCAFSKSVSQTSQVSITGCDGRRSLGFDDAGQQIAVVFETASPFDRPQLMAELVA